MNERDASHHLPVEVLEVYKTVSLPLLHARIQEPAAPQQIPARRSTNLLFLALTLDSWPLLTSSHRASLSDPWSKMKSICTTLYPNEHVGAKVSEYADHKSLDLPDALQEYHALVLRTQERSNYMISTLEAKFLKWLARSLGVKRGKSPDRPFLPRKPRSMYAVLLTFDFLSPGDWRLRRLFCHGLG